LEFPNNGLREEGKVGTLNKVPNGIIGNLESNPIRIINSPN